MYNLKKFCKLISLPIPNRTWDGNIVCIELDAEMTFGTNETRGFLSCYTFTIVIHGWVTILYNGRELTLHERDLYTYSPGFEVTVISASADYRSICLLADEQFTFSLPSARDIIRTAYFPAVELQEPILTLSNDDSNHLLELMQLIISYQQSLQPHAAGNVRLTYSLFLNDLIDIEKRSIKENRFSNRVEELFIAFQHLLSQHFVDHHDIGFYADKLCITTTYLSRIVRQVSDRTVTDYINQMLAMEASWLLQTTPLSVAQIADRLNFAETTTFARFFKRIKGCTPKEYRKNQ